VEMSAQSTVNYKFQESYRNQLVQVKQALKKQRTQLNFEHGEVEMQSYVEMMAQIEKKTDELIEKEFAKKNLAWEPDAVSKEIQRKNVEIRSSNLTSTVEEPK